MFSKKNTVIGFIIICAFFVGFIFNKRLSEPAVNKDILITTNFDKYFAGENVEILIENTSNKSYFVRQPQFTIEVYDSTKDQWNQIAYRYGCPCGAHCDFAPFIVIDPNKSKTFEWNQEEQVCSVFKNTETGQNELTGVISAVVPGTYRVTSKVAKELEKEGMVDYFDVFSEPFKIVATSKMVVNSSTQVFRTAENEWASIGENLASPIDVVDIEVTTKTEGKILLKNTTDYVIQAATLELSFYENLNGQLPNKDISLGEQTIEKHSVKLKKKKKKWVDISFENPLDKDFLFNAFVTEIWVELQN